MVAKARFWSVVAALVLCAGACSSAAAGDGPREKPLLEVFYLRYAEASSVAKPLADLLSGNADIKITADARTNALVVLASQGDLEALKGLIGLVDRAQQRGQAGTRSRPAPGLPAKDLEGASDRELRSRVADLAEQVRDLQERTKRLEAETRIRFRTIPLDGSGKRGEGRRPETKGRPVDERPAETRIKVFTLVNADAASLLSVLSELLPSVSQKSVRIAADKRTNSVLANGPEEDLRIVEAVLLRLDTEAPKRPSETALVPKPAGKAGDAEAGPQRGSRIRFDFQFQRWPDVLNSIARQSGLTLVRPKVFPPGTFNYRDPRTYTPDEAIDLLNGVLATKGYKLVKRGQTLELIAVPKGQADERKP